MDHAGLPANYTMPAFHFASVHQMAPPLTETEDIWLEPTAHLSTPMGWNAALAWLLTYSGWFTHISGHPSATGWEQDSEVRRPKTDVLPLFHAQYDLYVVGRHGVLCEVKWWRSVALFE